MKKSYLLLFTAFFVCTFSGIVQASTQDEDVFPQFGAVLIDGNNYRIMTKFSSTSGQRPVLVEYPTSIGWDYDDENFCYQTILSGTVQNEESDYFAIESFLSPTRVAYRELRTTLNETSISGGWTQFDKVKTFQAPGNHTLYQTTHLYDQKTGRVDGASFTRRYCRFAKYRFTQGRNKLRHFGTTCTITPVFEEITKRFPNVEQLLVERGEKVDERSVAVGGETESPECGADGYVQHGHVTEPDILTGIFNLLSQ
ncbi:MAG: hypothetical protein GY880_31220 [Planctomycetaceae bacterium]|nr:hypothetical protein [Planctomycetaceae bacterium]